ncbi:hypothetical protein EV132_11882 [Rhizobium sullae]|uniref:Uncharacterized protein n=1 Tax=Rhizobium sullae TaxID=50338 RepID=A0A4R3PZE1_RHISU|nr:hypothetical protein EV132_11882 [Rhizobium sullae]
MNVRRTTRKRRTEREFAQEIRAKSVQSVLGMFTHIAVCGIAFRAILRKLCFDECWSRRLCVYLDCAINRMATLSVP